MRLRPALFFCFLFVSSLLPAQRKGGGPAPAPRPSPSPSLGGVGGIGGSRGVTTTAPLGGANSFPSVPDKIDRPRRKPVADSELTFHAISNLVTLDLVATDRSGRLVRDLKPEDLEVFDEGKRQTITQMSLEDHPLPASAVVDTALEQKRRQAGIYDNYSSVQEWKGPVTILLLDAANTPFASQAYARNEMIKLLQTMPPGQPMAIYALGRSLRLVQDFTSDPNTVLEAARRVKTQTVGIRTDDVAESSLSDNVEGMSDDAYSSLIAFEQEDAAYRLDDRVRLTVSAFKDIARHALGYPGRKNLIWISSTFPLEVMSDWQLPNAAPVRIYYQDLHDLGTMLADAKIAVYPVDAEGLQALSTFDASKSGQINGHLATGAQFAAMLNQASQGIEAAHDTMNQIAEDTGGKAFYNRNDLDAAIRSAIIDGSSYYDVAFVPQNYVADGRLHTLKVKAKRSGLQLRYRRGYFAIDPYDPSHPTPERQKLMIADMRTALLQQAQNSTGVALAGRLDPGPLGSVTVALAGNSFTFVSTNEGKKHTAFELMTATFDGKGKPLALASHGYNVDLDEARFQQIRKQGFNTAVKFDRPPAATRLRIAVQDLNTGRVGSVDLPLPPLPAGAQSASAQNPQ